jgi:O-glycosyl hydrolase
MVISKYLSGNTPATINLANFTSNGVAQVWQLTAANTISRLADIGLSGNSFGITLPPQSITLFVVRSSNVPSLPNAPSNVTVISD